MDGWVGGWMDEWMDGWMGGWLDGWMDGWKHRQMDGRMDGWVGGWLDGWIFVNCNCVDARWQQYSTHLHKNSTQNNTINLGRVRTVPGLCEFYPGICLTTEEKSRRNISQGSRRVPDGTMKTEYTEQNIHNDKNT